jgi:hypothetical protein
MSEIDEWAEARWVERDGTGRTRSGVRAATQRAPRSEIAEERVAPFSLEREGGETWIGYAFRKLSRYAFIAPRHPSGRRPS